MGKDIVIIGGGIVGVSAAYALARSGAAVTLIESGELCAGSSYGNAGLICPCHSTPIPGPGVLLQGFKWMLDPESPFYIRPRIDPALAAWLWQFRRYCNEEARSRAIPVLLEMQRESLHLFRAWLDETGIAAGFEQAGGLELYLTEKKFGSAREEVRRMNEAGIRMALLDRGQVLELEPAASPNILGGIHYQEDAHIDPARFVAGLARQAIRHGARIQTHTRVLRLERQGDRIERILTSDEEIVPEQLIVAAGAWSPQLLVNTGIHAPVQAAKGYSITMRRPDKSPRMPLHLAEARMAVTPMGDTLRFAGTLELSGLDSTIQPRRVQAIRTGGRRYLATREPLDEIEVWAGLRPVTPDGLPMIGRSAQVSNLIVATGHAMLGVSMGPVTGVLVADLALGRPPGIHLDPFDPNRF